MSASVGTPRPAFALPGAARAELRKRCERAVRRARRRGEGVLAGLTVRLGPDVDPSAVVFASRRPGDRGSASSSPTARRRRSPRWAPSLRLEAAGPRRFADVAAAWRRLAGDGPGRPARRAAGAPGWSPSAASPSRRAAAPPRTGRASAPACSPCPRSPSRAAGATSGYGRRPGRGRRPRRRAGRARGAPAGRAARRAAAAARSGARRALPRRLHGAARALRGRRGRRRRAHPGRRLREDRARPRGRRARPRGARRRGGVRRPARRLHSCYVFCAVAAADAAVPRRLARAAGPARGAARLHGGAGGLHAPVGRPGGRRPPGRAAPALGEGPRGARHRDPPHHAHAAAPQRLGDGRRRSRRSSGGQHPAPRDPHPRAAHASRAARSTWPACCTRRPRWAESRTQPPPR